jgi:hypothetical protein
VARLPHRGRGQIRGEELRLLLVAGRVPVVVVRLVVLRLHVAIFLLVVVRLLVVAILVIVRLVVFTLVVPVFRLVGVTSYVIFIGSS